MLRALLLFCCALFTFSCEKSSDTISDAIGLESDSLAADPPPPPVNEEETDKPDSTVAVLR